MGSGVDKITKGIATGGISLIDDSGALGTGKSAAQRAQKAQKKAIAEQQTKETQRLAEAESEVARRKAVGTKSRSGRGSLMATTATGVAKTLGGT